MHLMERDKTRQAAEIVDARLGFLIHLAVLVAVISLLAFLDWREGAEWWVQWPLIGWGLGILLHAALVFGRMPRAAAEWRLRRINRLRQQL